jgi:uncharacterized protein (TIGR03032 family)
VKRPSRTRAEALWRTHDRAWREPAQVIARCEDASITDPRLLSWRASGAWWDVLRAANITLLVTREYEHLVMGLGADAKGPRLSYFPLPHPSGIAVDRERLSVHVASTRNPNQLVVFEPAGAPLPRRDVPGVPTEWPPLLPLRATFFPGSLYLHDLAFVGGVLYGSAAGQNAIVRLHETGCHEPAWWPRCIESAEGTLFGRNALQLNSIAAGPTLEQSYFTASTDRLSTRRPGHRNFPVDRRGVLFAGSTREAVVRGLTRPHSARLHDGRVWVANSGYGELGVCEAGGFEPVTRLPGWVRGLCFVGGLAFVGTSRVIPRFRQYAPGLRIERAVCGVHAVDLTRGRVVGSVVWPWGNQIFACDWMPAAATGGFPFAARGRQSALRARRLFYAFSTRTTDRSVRTRG